MHESEDSVRVNKRCRYLGLLVLMVMMAWSVDVTSASAWWNDQWQYRKEISLDTTASGADIQQNLLDFPVLVRLHSGNFDFTRAKENGEDLRFVGADDTTLLKYHIELFDAFDEIALIWVKAGNLAPGSNQGRIWLYYGNEDAADGTDSKGSFDGMFQGVYHFNEIENTPQDAASYSNHSTGFTGGLGLAGVIGNGATFSGAGNLLEIPDNPSFDFSAGFTFSTWIKVFQAQEEARLFSRMAGDQGIRIDIRGTKVVVTISDGNRTVQTDEDTDLPLEGWHHLAVTIVPGGRLSVYLDGTETQWLDVGADLSAIKGNILIGGDAAGNRSFAGDLDELRISGAARPMAWVRAEFVSQGPDAGLVFYALEEINEAGGGLPVFYLATIFKNITLDGLFVISLLLIMSGLSWIVMISKSIFLFNTSRGNKNFLDLYHQSQDPMALETRTDRFNGSGLYRIYEAGCRNLEFLSRQTDPETEADECIPKIMPEKTLDNLKAALEKGLVDEAKKLNAWLVVLTMSISGGPFLGLLGTGWGVMNTFAAMAEAGEANIMAIAPGVASALSTTVFGLIVAIPALFGYNYLVGKIRDITADSGIFVDQFALKVDSVYGGQP